MRTRLLWQALSLLLVAGGSEASAADLQACVAQRRAAMSAELTQDFAVPGRAICPATAPDAVGAGGARLVRQDRSTTLIFVPPAGYVIDPASLRVEEAATPASSGEHGVPAANGNRASVVISCRGLPPGQGESSYGATLKGRMARPLTPEMQAEIEADCRGR